MGDDFCALAHELILSGTLCKFPNQGLIKIIPNNSRRDSLSRWPLITLLGVYYKTIEKALTIIVRYVANQIVCQEQTCFVPRQFILGMVLSAWKAMDWEKESYQRSLFLKIEFDKSYDHIDRNFIPCMLKCLGFG